MKPVGDTPSTPVGSLSPTQPAPVAKDSSSAEAGEAKKIRLKPSVSTEEDAAAKAALKPAATLDPDQVGSAYAFSLGPLTLDSHLVGKDRTGQEIQCTLIGIGS